MTSVTQPADMTYFYEPLAPSFSYTHSHMHVQTVTHMHVQTVTHMHVQTGTKNKDAHAQTYTHTRIQVHTHKYEGHPINFGSK